MAEVNLTGIPRFDTFEIIKTGKLTITKGVNSDLASATYNHNLGYIPMALVFFEQSDIGLHIPLPYVAVFSGGLIANLMYPAVNDTDLTVTLQAPNLGGGSPYTLEQVFDIKYYLYRQIATS